TIIKQGTTVKGLTTAASLWAVACIGLAAGIGFYTAAILAGIVVFMTLVLLSKFEKVFRRKSSDELDISMRLQNTPGKLGEMVSAIGKLGMQINNVSIEDEEEDYLTVQLTLSLSKNDDAEDILAIIKEIPGVHMVSYSPWNMRTS
ncbi:MAG: MgtC/SapB transporter family protein, partial [Leptolinea sp.]|nr:MgtC/SapB transporter family protein [Leptolinea sp.]